MARRISESTLNASTVDILNVIRQNASLEYQNTVPAVTTATDIPRVGDALVGHPAMANIFINSLINRIALVRARSATFNNPYSDLKKGYLEYGEMIEDIFVEIAKIYEYSAEKAEAREFKRTLPEVHSIFHVINWRAVYPVTIEDNALQQAFLSADGVTDLIARIVDQIYTAAEYDEFLLFKYLIIKAVSSGKMYPEAVDVSDIKNAAVAFRGMSNSIQFMHRDFNQARVLNNTPRSRQRIFMDANFNAQFDVNVLASAFNMDKADFIGRLHLIDDFTTFDNDRFTVIRANSTGLEEVTAAELALMADVVAILIDEEWFQVYDNLNKFTEKYVASGLYWNYFYHTWKTLSSSPYHNAIVFVKNTATITPPATLTYTVSTLETSAEGQTVIGLTLPETTPGLAAKNFVFVQTEDAIENLVGVQPYGALLIPDGVSSVDVAVTNGTTTLEATVTLSGLAVGDTITFEAASEGDGGEGGGGEGGGGGRP